MVLQTIKGVIDMRICIPKEAYPLEKRVILLPSAVQQLREKNHDIYVQSGAGSGIDISDEAYLSAGATMLVDPRELYAIASAVDEKPGMIMKVKAPLENEFSLMKDTILFCMFHSEQNPKNTYYAGLQNLIVVEMEQIRDHKNERLINQTRMTGEAGVLYALRHSKKMPYDMKAVVLGYGNVSSGAVSVCSKLGIEYKILRKSEFKYVGEYLKEADLLINGIAWPESARQKREYVVTREHIKNARPNLIILDLSVDFPNPIETIKPTDYSVPYYEEEKRIHISVYGYPGLFPETSSKIYSEQALPMALLIADNEGLRGIGNRGDLGAAIKKAILDPKKMDWEKYKPVDVTAGSKIE